MKQTLLLFSLFLAFGLTACREKASSSTDEGAKQDSTLPVVISENKPASITGTHWKLTEIIGKSISHYPAQNKEPYLFFKDDGTVEGTGGCNGLSGTYELMEHGKIKFSPMAATKMACPDMTLENDFVHALGYADRYTSDGKTFTLGKDGMPPLAKFETQ